MRKFTFTNKEKQTFKRISKRAARAAYNNGLTIVICSCNVRPFTEWGCEVTINKKDCEPDDIDFDKAVNAFEWYNCNYSELGKYAAFYIQD